MSYSLICETIRQRYGNQWFSGKQLAEQLGLNYNTIRKKLWNLVEFGFLEKKQIEGLNFYRLAEKADSESKIELADELEAMREQIRDIARVVTQLKQEISEIKKVLEITPAEPVTYSSLSEKEQVSKAELITEILYQIGKKKGKF